MSAALLRCTPVVRVGEGRERHVRGLPKAEREGRGWAEGWTSQNDARACAGTLLCAAACVHSARVGGTGWPDTPSGRRGRRFTKGSRIGGGGGRGEYPPTLGPRGGKI